MRALVEFSVFLFVISQKIINESQMKTLSVYFSTEPCASFSHILKELARCFMEQSQLY